MNAFSRAGMFCAALGWMPIAAPTAAAPACDPDNGGDRKSVV